MEMSKDLVAASATPLVLAILAEGDSYGYAIIKRVTELSGGHLQWTDGMLYPVLHRLERQGQVADGGRVFEAIATDTYERNRNLLLTEGARADSVPNLEILTGEVVGAGHASTSGRLEDEHLFYLMARGIPLDEARRLVIRGFFGQLIAKIEVAELRERITAAIENELAHLPGLQGGPAEGSQA